jgi:hypothetical protein
MSPNCVARTVSTVSPQSLMLMNNQRIRELAADMARRVEGLLAEQEAHNPAARVDLVYQLALSRSPSEKEKRLAIETLRDMEADWNGRQGTALETYCHIILNSAAFLYVD